MRAWKLVTANDLFVGDIIDAKRLQRSVHFGSIQQKIRVYFF